MCDLHLHEERQPKMHQVHIPLTQRDHIQVETLEPKTLQNQNSNTKSLNC